MYKQLIAIFLLSTIVFAIKADPFPVADVQIMKIPPSAHISPSGDVVVEPASSSAQHRQSDLKVLREREELSSEMRPEVNMHDGFLCPADTQPSCLAPGDNVCPGSTKCVDENATCFEQYPCETSGGFVCGAEYDEVLNDYQNAVRQNNELASENVGLRESRLDKKNCVLNASTLEDAKTCVRI